MPKRAGRFSSSGIGYSSFLRHWWGIRHSSFSLWYLLHVRRVQAPEEPRDLFGVEHRVASLDAQEKQVAAGAGETRHVEERVVRHRQAVPGEHAEHGGEGRAEDRALECRRDER